MSIVNYFKNLLTARFALLCCLVGTAGPGLAGNKVYIENFSIQPGETKTIAVCLESDKEFRSLSGTIMMPAGLEVQNQSENAGTYLWITTDANRVSAANAQYNPAQGLMKISCFGTTITPGKGSLAYIVVKATEALENPSVIALSEFTGKDAEKNVIDLATGNATVTTGDTPQLGFNPSTITVTPGVIANVDVTLDNIMELSGMQANVTVSDGLMIAGSPVKGDRVTGEIAANKETMTVFFQGSVPAGSGTVMTVPIVATKSFTGGTVKLSEIVVTTTGATSYYPEDIVLNVELSDGSLIISNLGGVTSVVVDETKGTPQAGIITDGLLAKSFSYKRILPAGKACTVCLPYAPATAGIKFYELAGVNGKKLNFKEVASPAANTPYLAVAEANTQISPAAGSNVTLTQEATGSSSADGYTLKGTLTGLTNAEGVAAGAYILQSDGDWKKVTTALEGAYIPPFRAYVVGGSEGRLISCFDDATAIDGIQTVDLDGKVGIYDLNGRRVVSPVGKRVYIVNGKKLLK